MFDVIRRTLFDIGMTRAPMRRHKDWRKVRAEHLEMYPWCVITGVAEELEVHHVVPVHVDPSRELDRTNLRTVSSYGPGNIDYHYLCGHPRGWRSWNPNFDACAAVLREMFDRARYGAITQES